MSNRTFSEGESEAINQTELMLELVNNDTENVKVLGSICEYIMINIDANTQHEALWFLTVVDDAYKISETQCRIEFDKSHHKILFTRLMMDYMTVATGETLANTPKVRNELFRYVNRFNLEDQ